MSHKKLKRWTTLAALAVGLALSAQTQAQAQDWPTHPIEWACVTTPGSGAANWCLLMAKLTGEALGQPVEVLFKAGGNGNEAAEYVANRPADGYTWLQRNTSYAGYMSLKSFKPNPDDFINIVNVEKYLYVLAVPADSKYKTFQDLIADMKANPGKISIGSGKVGSVQHIHLVRLFQAFGVEWNTVPYGGTGEAMKDALGGHVAASLGPPAIWKPHVDAGKARILILLNEKPSDSAALKGVPTPAELGHPYELQHQVQGIFVKKGTPPAVQEKIAAAFTKAIEAPEYKAYLEKNQDIESVLSTDAEKNTAEFNKIRKETADYMRKAGLLN